MNTLIKKLLLNITALQLQIILEEGGFDISDKKVHAIISAKELDERVIKIEFLFEQDEHVSSSTLYISQKCDDLKIDF